MAALRGTATQHQHVRREDLPTPFITTSQKDSMPAVVATGQHSATRHVRHVRKRCAFQDRQYNFGTSRVTTSAWTACHGDATISTPPGRMIYSRFAHWGSATPRRSRTNCTAQHATALEPCPRNETPKATNTCTWKQALCAMHNGACTCTTHVQDGSGCAAMDSMRCAAN